MVSVRLPRELEEKLESVSKSENLTKTDIIKEALEEYIVNIEKSKQPYKLGEDLFGKYGSGDGTLSRDYKKKVRGKVHEKMSH